MRKKIIYVSLFVFSFAVTGNHYLKSISAQDGDVMGTSVVVSAPVTELEIIKIETDETYQDRNIKAKVTLNNLTEEEKLIDKVNIVVKKLGGSVELSESINIDQEIKTEGETNFSIEFPGNLKSGEYVGAFELFSKGKLLGSSETLISISPADPRVLGAYAENYDYLLLPSVMIFAGAIFVSLFLLLKKKSILMKGISIKLFDLIVVILGLSVFGLGMCGGYLFCKTFFSSGIYLVEKQETKESNNEVSEVNPLDEGSNEESFNFIFENESLSLYSKPDDNAELVYKLEKDTELEVIDQASGWYRVILEDGTNGWVRIEELQKLY